MPDSPMEAKFLKYEEKLVAIERLRMNQMGIGSGVWKWDHVWEAFMDPKTYLWFSLMLVISYAIHPVQLLHFEANNGVVVFPAAESRPLAL